MVTSTGESRVPHEPRRERCRWGPYRDASCVYLTPIRHIMSDRLLRFQLMRQPPLVRLGRTAQHEVVKYTAQQGISRLWGFFRYCARRCGPASPRHDLSTRPTDLLRCGIDSSDDSNVSFDETLQAELPVDKVVGCICLVRCRCCIRRSDSR